MDSVLGGRLAALIEHSQDTILIVDEEGMISFVNEAADRTLGYESDEMTGTNAFEYIHPDDREIVVDRFSELINDPEHVTDRSTHRLQMRMDTGNGSNLSGATVPIRRSMDTSSIVVKSPSAKRTNNVSNSSVITSTSSIRCCGTTSVMTFSW